MIYAACATLCMLSYDVNTRQVKFLGTDSDKVRVARALALPALSTTECFTKILNCHQIELLSGDHRSQRH